MTTFDSEHTEAVLLNHVRSLLKPKLVHRLSRIGRGQSNPTYLVGCEDRNLILRSKPPGKLLKSAHLVEREYRVMSALAMTPVPVPKTVALVEDKDSPLGKAFYLMEFVDGEVHFDPTLPGLDREQRGEVYDDMNRVLAELHKVEVEQVGLGDFGRPGNYFERQTGRWKKQYYSSRLSANRDMDRLVAWLEANMIEDDGEVALVHGDFRLDNLVIDRESQRVLAVLDWELSTLGHPMADLAYQCMQWRMPFNGALRGLGGISRPGLGLPQEDEYLSRYCSRRGIDIPPNWTFYLVFAFFRLASILEGVGRRAVDGNAANPELAVEYGRQVPLLVERAIEVLESGA